MKILQNKEIIFYLRKRLIKIINKVIASVIIEIDIMLIVCLIQYY